MRRTRYIGLILATVLGLTTLAVLPVAAEDGGGTSGSSDSSTSTSTSTTNQTETKDTTTPAETETEVQHLRTNAISELETERKNGQEHSQTERENACKAHEDEINTRSGNYADAAQRHLDVFTSVLTKVQDFYTSKGLNVATYPALLATAQADQAAAQKAVDALKALNVKIDCTQPDPAQSVATLKAAVANARTALHAYRSAIKDIIVALEGASSANETTTAGGNQ